MQSKYSMESATDWIICPYNQAHRLTPRRFSIHLLKCRRNFRATQALAGEPIEMLTCQYSHYHQVDWPEIIYHESICDHRSKVRSYQLNVVEGFGRPDLLYYNLKDYHQDNTELSEIYGGTYLDHIIGTNLWGKTLSIRELKSMTPEEQERMRISVKMKHSRHDPFGKEEGYLENLGVVEQRTTTGTQQVKDGDDGNRGDAISLSVQETKEDKKGPGYDTDDDWGEKERRDGPSFDYMQNIWNPSSRHIQIPPSLGKAERELFMKIHGKRLAEESKRNQIEKTTQLEMKFEQWKLDPDDPELPEFVDVGLTGKQQNQWEKNKKKAAAQTKGSDEKGDYQFKYFEQPD